MSYDVGFAKPDRRIFDAAEHMANQLLAMQQQRGAETGSSGSAKGDSPWLKLYVGDDFEKDVVGAQGAGWNAVFVSPEEHSVSDQKKDMSDLEQLEGKTLEDVFPQDGPSPTLIRAERTQSFLAWLMKRCAEGDQ
jgi:FMN phosphatase YigB (HAD superfamily)